MNHSYRASGKVPGRFMSVLSRPPAAVVLSLLLGSGFARAEEQPTTVIDPQRTAESLWEEGRRLASGSNEINRQIVEFTRYFIGMTEQGNVLVQNFYSYPDKKQSDPYLMPMDESQLLGWVGSVPEHGIIGCYSAYFSNGNLFTKGCYNGGYRHGKWQFMFDNGQVAEEGNYLDGILHGQWLGYYENGQLFRKVNYVNGKIDGVEEYWHDNGNPMKYAEYRNGTPVGKSQSWYQNGQLELSGHFNLQGEKDGEWTTWYENGAVLSRENFSKGQYEGKWSSGYENGQKHQELIYVQGRREGPYHEYHMSGGLMVQGQYSKGQYAGVWRSWDESGQLVNERDYDSSQASAR